MCGARSAAFTRSRRPDAADERREAATARGLLDPLVTEPGLQRPRVRPEPGTVRGEAVPQRVPGTSRRVQAGARQDALDVPVHLVVAELRAIDVAHHVALAGHYRQATERRAHRLGHGDLATRAALRGRGDAQARLRCYGDCAGHQVHVLAPPLRLDLAAAWTSRLDVSTSRLDGETCAKRTFPRKDAVRAARTKKCHGRDEAEAAQE